MIRCRKFKGLLSEDPKEEAFSYDFFPNGPVLTFRLNCLHNFNEHKWMTIGNVIDVRAYAKEHGYYFKPTSRGGYYVVKKHEKGKTIQPKD